MRGRGGYCFHLNGAFSALLGSLGFDVTRHVGGVQRAADPAPVGAVGNHMALTVRTADGPWLVDVGLADGPHEPLPLRAGRYRQGPFEYGLAPSAVVPGGWRFEHDPAGAFPGGASVSTVDGSQVMHFDIDPFRKYCLLNGLDEIGLTLRHADKIRAFEDRRKTQYPWYY